MVNAIYLEVRAWEKEGETGLIETPRSQRNKSKVEGAE